MVSISVTIAFSRHSESMFMYEYNMPKLKEEQQKHCGTPSQNKTKQYRSLDVSWIAEGVVGGVPLGIIEVNVD